MKSEKYQQGKVIIQQAIYQIKYNYKLIEVDLTKQNALDAAPRANQQILFQGVVGGENKTKIRSYTILEQSKETMLEFYKGIGKVCEQYKWLKTVM